MPIQGLRTTADFVADQRPKNYREMISMLYPNGKAPLTALTSMMKSKKIDDPEFNWWEKNLESRRFVLGANLAVATAGTVQNITLVAGSNNASIRTLKAGDLLYVEQTGEIIRVNSDPTSTTQLNVQRGFGGTSSATLVDFDAAGINPNLSKIGSAYPEGSTAPVGVSFDPTKQYNYTQIHRDTFEATRTAMKTRLRTGDAVKEAKRECLEYHAIGLEKTFIFGTRSELIDGATGKPIRTSGGAISFIPSDNNINVPTTYSGGLTMDGLELYMESVFRFGSSEKVALLGNRALTVLNQVIRKNSHWIMEPTTAEYNFFKVARLVTPHGVLVLKTHPLFNQITGGTTAGTAYHGQDSWMLVLDMAQIKYNYIDDTMYQQKLQDNGLDGEKSGYLTECGLEFGQASTHFLFKGLVKAAVDS